MISFVVFTIKTMTHYPINRTTTTLTTQLGLKVCELSVRTITCVLANTRFNVGAIYDLLQISPSLVFATFEKQRKGVHPNIKYKIPKNVFRNSISTVIYLNDRYVNMRISPSGLFQFTGCKDYSQVIDSIVYMLKLIPYNNNYINVDEGGQCSEFVLKCHMTNIRVVVDQHVYREELRDLINRDTQWHAMFQSNGYAGVNIKMKYYDGEITPENFATIVNLTLPKLTFNWISGKHLIANISYAEYIDNLKPEQVVKEYEWFARKRISFMVFRPGSITISGIHEDLMSNLCNTFMEFLFKHKETIFYDESVLLVEY